MMMKLHISLQVFPPLSMMDYMNNEYYADKETYQ